MKAYLKLMRIHHYIKNLLIFVPLFFSRRFFETYSIIQVSIGFLAFSFLCSIVYIINDIQDVEKDRQHPVKCKRPLAAGKVSKKGAAIFCVILFLLINGLGCIGQWKLDVILVLMVYLIINILYSCAGWKNIPVLDITILAMGFLLRILFGASVAGGIEVSNWLYLTVTSMAFWMGIGKRRNELRKQRENANHTRKVLQYYTYSFLDKNMYMCMALMIVFYSLWSVDSVTLANLSTNKLVWSVPLVIVIAMKYSMELEKEGEGDPVEVLLHDKVLLGLGGIFAVFLSICIYWKI